MRGMNRPGKSGYFGVIWNEASKKYAVYMRQENKIKYFGLYKNKLEAAKAYDKEVFKFRGKSGRFNFPEDYL